MKSLKLTQYDITKLWEALFDADLDENTKSVSVEIDGGIVVKMDAAFALQLGIKDDYNTGIKRLVIINANALVVIVSCSDGKHNYYVKNRRAVEQELKESLEHCYYYKYQN